MGYENGVPAIGALDAASGAYTHWWSGQAAFMDRFWQHFSVSGDGTTLAVAREDTGHPPDIWIARMNKDALEWKQLGQMNPQAADLTLGVVDQIFWPSSDGLEIQGYLIKPTGYVANQSYPLIVWVHGGPAGNFGPRYYALDSRFQLLAANGFMVMLPNPRGSLGWGTAFTESNVGDMGGMDWQDIMTGVDYCIAQGWADKNRLGLAGWSYGGFMTAWGITQTDRFKAAMMGAAITDWLSFHGTSNLAVWDELANNASPYERGGPYDKFSPMNHIAHAKTPTLILHGEADPYVPVSQGYEVFRALKDMGVETEMIVYPREGHHFDEKNHQLDMMRRIVAWFKKHLLEER
jgi:dipeptidyl aminopeptidase/acylaminoacyl peptidase